MARKIIFSTTLVNTKIVDNFVGFPKSTIKQISEFICGRYDQTIELDRNKSEQVVMT
jgi:hypothetical protein